MLLSNSTCAATTGPVNFKARNGKVVHCGHDKEENDAADADAAAAAVTPAVVEESTPAAAPVEEETPTPAPVEEETVGTEG